MASIHVNGIDLYYEVHGSGMPLVMLHGNGEDHTTFSTLCAALQDRFQIYLFDTRGHGKSTPVSRVSLQRYAQDMTEALIQLFDGADRSAWLQRRRASSHCFWPSGIRSW